MQMPCRTLTARGKVKKETEQEHGFLGHLEALVHHAGDDLQGHPAQAHHAAHPQHPAPAKESRAAAKPRASQDGDDDGHAIRRHVQAFSHHYMMHFPAHPAREDDPHYADFDHFHRKTRRTARCYIGERVGFHDCRDADGSPCPPPSGAGQQPGLELHHSHIEFSLQNGISLKALEKDYPGISVKSQVGAWVESADNLQWLCAYHHRGAGGAHTAAHADFEASQYVLGLIRPAQDAK
jgi:hypothetical protein